jgi:uncharacterized protein YecT (DUF1311 family)
MTPIQHWSNRQTIFILSVSVLLALASSIAVGQSAIFANQDLAQTINCKDPKTQLEINQCAAQDAKAADRTLNQVYQQARRFYRDRPSLENQLIDAQLAWIKFRDTNCKFSTSRFEGGSIAPLVFSRCTERLTKQRTQELQDYTKEGGGLF